MKCLTSLRQAWDTARAVNLLSGEVPPALLHCGLAPVTFDPGALM